MTGRHPPRQQRGRDGQRTPRQEARRLRAYHQAITRRGYGRTTRPRSLRGTTPGAALGRRARQTLPQHSARRSAVRRRPRSGPPRKGALRASRAGCGVWGGCTRGGWCGHSGTPACRLARLHTPSRRRRGPREPFSVMSRRWRPAPTHSSARNWTRFVCGARRSPSPPGLSRRLRLGDAPASCRSTSSERACRWWWRSRGSTTVEGRRASRDMRRGWERRRPSSSAIDWAVPDSEGALGAPAGSRC